MNQTAAEDLRDMLNIARLRTGDEAADDLRCPSAQARVS
jgi:hypothetical protein